MLLSTPRPYQAEGIDLGLAALKKDESFIIGDEMGLGKTLQGLGVADRAPKKEKRIGVVVPSFLKEKWRAQIKEHLGKNRNYSFSIASFNELTNPQNLFFFTKNRYDLTIIDEAHYIKDFAAQRTRAILGAPTDKHRTVASVSDALVSLSGTWPPNRVGETYPLLYRMNHPLTKGLTYEKFLNKYAKTTRLWGDKLLHDGVKNMDEFRKLLGRNFICRKMDDVEKDIPPGTADVIPVECSKEVEKEERKLLEELLLMAGHTRAEFPLIFNSADFFDLLVENMPEFPRLSEFRKRQGLLKIKPVMEHLTENVLPECKKFILFCYHKDVAEKYVELLTKKKVKTYLIHGQNTKAKDRFEFAKQINAEKDAVLVATMDAVKEGLDLICFNRSFYAEYDWRSYIIDQTKGRTRRYGQTKPQFWTFFSLDCGVEQAMAKKVLQKNSDLREIRGK